MLDEQKKELERLVEANEQMKGPRVIIDYAISLACSFSPDIYNGLNHEMTEFVEELYRNKYL